MKDLIAQTQTNIKECVNRVDKVKTSHLFLTNSVKELSDMELVDVQNVDDMKKRISCVLSEVYPEYQIMGKERLEKKRLEKERLKKERLEGKTRKREAKLEDSDNSKRNLWRDSKWEAF